MNKVKCGNVFITEDGDFSFLCINCSFAFWEYHEYRNHVLDSHLIEFFYGDTDLKANIKLDTGIEFEVIKTEDNDSNDKSCDENFSEILTIEKLTEEILNDDHDSVEKIEFYETKSDSADSDTRLSAKLDSENSQEKSTNEVHFCTKCNEQFSSVQLFDDHKQTCDTIICPLCLMEITQNVSKHISDCRSKFDGKRLKTLKTKEEKTPVSEKFPCHHCDRVFYIESAFRKHYAIHESNMDKCDTCGKRFRTLESLKNHIRRHKGEKPFKCTVCPAAFNDKINLKTHYIVRHTEGLKLPCEYGCGKIFKTLELRKRHERYMHQKDRNFLCLSCGMSFKTSSKLNEHTKKKHLEYEDRPHVCNVCKKKFVFPQDLKNHTMTHTGEKPHKCEICTKAFIKKYDLNKHIKKKHNTYANDQNADILN